MHGRIQDFKPQKVHSEEYLGYNVGQVNTQAIALIILCATILRGWNGRELRWIYISTSPTSAPVLILPNEWMHACVGSLIGPTGISFCHRVFFMHSSFSAKYYGMRIHFYLSYVFSGLEAAASPWPLSSSLRACEWTWGMGYWMERLWRRRGVREGFWSCHFSSKINSSPPWFLNVVNLY